MKICYVSQNQLHLWENGETAALSSQRMEQYFRTLEELDKRNAWKTEGTSARFQGQHNPYEHMAENARVTYTAVALSANHLYYALNLNNETGCIQRKTLSDPNGPEGMVLSNRGFVGEDFCLQGERAFLSVQSIRGQWHIAMLNPENGRYDTITSGDTVDSHPVLSRDGNYLYYDAAGHARNEDGMVLGKGPRSVLRLNLNTNQLDDVLEDEKTNFARYEEDGTGGYYVMARPYTPPKPREGGNPLGCLMAPWYMIRGMFTFFTAIGKLKKDGNAPAASGPSAAKQTMHLDGEWVDVQKALTENQRSGAPYPGLVPASWTLEKGSPDGTRRTLSKGVLHYQLLPDGTLYYTNGRHIIRRTPEGKEESLVQGKTITLFAVLPEEA